MSSREFTTPLRIEISSLEQIISNLKIEKRYLKKEIKFLREALKGKLK